MHEEARAQTESVALPVPQYELEDLLRRQWGETARLFIAFAESPHGAKPTLPPKPDRHRTTLLDADRRPSGFSPLPMRAGGEPMSRARARSASVDDAGAFIEAP